MQKLTSKTALKTILSIAHHRILHNPASDLDDSTFVQKSFLPFTLLFYTSLGAFYSHSDYLLKELLLTVHQPFAGIVSNDFLNTLKLYSLVIFKTGTAMMTIIIDWVRFSSFELTLS